MAFTKANINEEKYYIKITNEDGFKLIFFIVLTWNLITAFYGRNIISS